MRKWRNKQSMPEDQAVQVTHEEADTAFDVAALSNEGMFRYLRRVGYGWLIIAFLSVLITTETTLSSHPAYLHDWHILAIILLDLILMGAYGSLFLVPSRRWPLSLRFSLSLWLIAYLVITLLFLIDSNFLWNIFLAFGLGFALFGDNTRRMVTSSIICYLTFGIFLGVFSLPLSWGTIGTFFGLGTIFFSFTTTGIQTRRLMDERFKSNLLLQKLTLANRELTEAHEHLALSAAQEQELSILRERNRLAREMHDTLGHSLVLVSIKLEAAQRLRAHDPERSDAELDSTKEIIRGSMNDLRASIANLRSPSLEREPAGRALCRSAREMGHRMNAQVICVVPPDLEKLPEPLEETLWKVGQEALANSEKHSHAQNILVLLERLDDSVLLRVQDDGTGLPANLRQEEPDGSYSFLSPEGHYGLNNMTDRVKNAGGQLLFKSVDPHGTVVEVIVPLPEVS